MPFKVGFDEMHRLRLRASVVQFIQRAAPLLNVYQLAQCISYTVLVRRQWGLREISVAFPAVPERHTSWYQATVLSELKKNVIWNRLNYTRGGFGVIIKASFKALFWICFNTELRLFILLWTVDTSENLMKATDSLFKEIRLYVNFGRQFRGIHLIQKAT